MNGLYDLALEGVLNALASNTHQIATLGNDARRAIGGRRQNEAIGAVLQMQQHVQAAQSLIDAALALHRLDMP